MLSDSYCVLHSEVGRISTILSLSMTTDVFSRKVVPGALGMTQRAWMRVFTFCICRVPTAILICSIIERFVVRVKHSYSGAEKSS